MRWDFLLNFFTRFSEEEDANELMDERKVLSSTNQPDL
jgi:hypothetical protein